MQGPDKFSDAPLSFLLYAKRMSFLIGSWWRMMWMLETGREERLLRYGDPADR